MESKKRVVLILFFFKEGYAIIEQNNYHGSINIVLIKNKYTLGGNY
jgi:hypothetical protein